MSTVYSIREVLVSIGVKHAFWEPSLLMMSKGTGKSVLLREIIKALRRKYEKTPDVIAITASTGNILFLRQNAEIHDRNQQ